MFSTWSGTQYGFKIWQLLLFLYVYKGLFKVFPMYELFYKKDIWKRSVYNIIFIGNKEYIQYIWFSYLKRETKGMCVKGRGKDLPNLPTDQFHWISSAQVPPSGSFPLSQGHRLVTIQHTISPFPSIPSGGIDLKLTSLGTQEKQKGVAYILKDPDNTRSLVQCKMTQKYLLFDLEIKFCCCRHYHTLLMGV